MSENEITANLLNCLDAKNIKTIYHSANGLCIEVIDINKIKQEDIKKIPNITDLKISGNLIQINVNESDKLAIALNETIKKSDVKSFPLTKEDKKAQEKKAREDFERMCNENRDNALSKHGKLSVIFKRVAGIFIPIIPAFIACGLVMAIYQIIEMASPGFQKTDIGKIFGIICNSVFGILHVIVGYNTCRSFGGSGIIGACLAGILYSMDLAGIKIGPFEFEPKLGGIIAVLMLSIGSAYFEKLIRNLLPNTANIIVTPLITILVMAFAGLFLVQPLAGLIAKGLTIAVEAISKNTPYLLGVVSLFYLFMVMLGIHSVLIPINAALIEASPDKVTPLLAMELLAGAAQVGAAIYVVLSTRNKRVKKMVASSIPVGILGIDEPLIWGMSFSMKRLFVASSVGGAIAGSIAAVGGLGASQPVAMGIEAAFVFNSPLGYVIIFIAAIILGFVVAALVGYKDTYSTIDENGHVCEVNHETSLAYKFIKIRKSRRSADANATVSNQSDMQKKDNSKNS